MVVSRDEWVYFESPYSEKIKRIQRIFSFLIALLLTAGPVEIVTAVLLNRSPERGIRVVRKRIKKISCPVPDSLFYMDRSLKDSIG